MDKFEALKKAKHNVTWLLDHPDGCVDFKGIVYWAGEVARLRAEIRATL